MKKIITFALIAVIIITAAAVVIKAVKNFPKSDLELNTEEYGENELPFAEDDSGISIPKDLKNGDVFEFGSYPQAKVTDKKLIKELDRQEKDLKSYNYFSADEPKLIAPDESEESYVEKFGKEYVYPSSGKDLMRYADVEYNSQKYRYVKINCCRPYFCNGEANAENSYQDENGYTEGNGYWFKYEPITWVVIDAQKGFVVTEKNIDAQPFCNIVSFIHRTAYNDAGDYGNIYSSSTSRKWLNLDFTDTAFSSKESGLIVKTDIESPSVGSGYDSEPTKDDVFLLSQSEIENSNNTFSLKPENTDYAECMGIKDNSFILRNSGAAYSYVAAVENGEPGQISCTAVCGIRPAMRLNLFNINN